MKELSIDEKAEAYDKALERVKDFIEKQNPPAFDKNLIGTIFPELAGSEDEKIRREIMEYITLYKDSLDDDEYKSWIAWLKKQAEQKSIWHNEDEEPKRDSLILLIMQSGTPIVAKIIEPNHTFNHGERWAYIDDLLEKQGNKEEPQVYKTEGGEVITYSESEGYKVVEPKFKVGDWVVSPNGVYWHIDSIQNGRYEVTADTGQCGNWPLDTNIYRLWTIQDAKDGNVLTNGNFPCIFKRCDDNGSLYVYCGINAHNDFSILSEDPENVWDDYSKQYFPATKEQRDLLFQKMKEAGYEWDAEKKELKKIEDEEYNGEDYGIDSLWHAKNILEETLGKVDGYQTDDGILEHKCAIAAVNKLYKQKPKRMISAEAKEALYDKPDWSEKDENVLEDIEEAIINYWHGDTQDILLDWLKSLKQRIGG